MQKVKRLSGLVVLIVALVISANYASPVSAQSPTQAATASAVTATAIIPKGSKIKLGWGGDQSLQLVKASSGVLHGAQIAVNRRNASGGISGFQIELVPQDDQCAGDQGTTVAQKFASDPLIVGIVGHVCSGATINASVVYEKARIPLVSASATADKVTARGLDVVNRVAFNDNNQSLGDVLFMTKTLKATKLAVIDDAQSYGKGLADAVNADFTALGGKVVLDESIDPAAKDYSAVLTKLLADPPDVIFFGGYEGPAALITSQAKSLGLKAVFFSDDGAKTSTYLKLAGQDAEGDYVSAISTPGMDAAAIAAFKTEYEKTFSVTYDDEQPYQPNGYDAASILLDSIAKVATTDAQGNLVIDREALIKTVRGTKDFKGLTGTLTCNSIGECGAGEVGVYQIKNGDFTQVGNYGPADLTPPSAAPASTMAATMAPTATK